MVAPTPLVGLWLAGLIAGALSVLSWRERPTPGATPLSVTMALATWWIVANVAGLLATTMQWRLFWANVEWIGIVLLPVAWLWFCLEYTGRHSLVTRRTAALVLGVPALSVGVIWTDGMLHNAFRQNVDTVPFTGTVLLETTPGPVYWLIVGYTYLLLAAGVFVLGELWFENEPTHRTQTTALILAAALPAVVGLGYAAGIGASIGFDPTPIAVAASGGMLATAVRKFGLFRRVPVPGRVAREAVIEAMDDGVLVVDSTGRIVDINPNGAAIIGCSTAEAIGLQAADQVPGFERAREAGDETTVIYDRGGAKRYLNVRISTFPGNRRDGAVVALRDVTADQRREQRLDVLNRVLRHNLRNDLNVVHGYAEHLESEQTYKAEAVQRIKRRSESLMSTGEKARAVEEFLDREGQSVVEVQTLIEHEVERLRTQYNSVDVSVGAVPEQAHCQDAISPVVRDLLENAVEHNTTDTPEVRIDAQRHGGELVLTISDNGPGIPDAERAVLERGEETPLEHGSGLGLWLVVWGLRELNGTVEFDDSAEAGCTVIVRVPVEDSGQTRTSTVGAVSENDSVTTADTVPGPD